MRVTIEVDEALLADAQRIVGGDSLRAVVHGALEAVVRQHANQELAALHVEVSLPPRRRFSGKELADVEWSDFPWARPAK